MDLKVLKVYESGTARVAYQERIPGTAIVTSIRGYVEVIVGEVAEGDIITLPDTLTLTIDKRSHVDQESGEELSFDWFVFTPA